MRGTDFCYVTRSVVGYIYIYGLITLTCLCGVGTRLLSSVE